MIHTCGVWAALAEEADGKASQFNMAVSAMGAELIGDAEAEELGALAKVVDLWRGVRSLEVLQGRERPRVKGAPGKGGAWRVKGTPGKGGAWS